MVLAWKKRKDDEISNEPVIKELEFLVELIVEGDTWATFMAFTDDWASSPMFHREQEIHLPRIYQIDKAGELSGSYPPPPDAFFQHT